LPGRWEYKGGLPPLLDVPDHDDMVQKGYGGPLKEASRRHQKEVLDYVMRTRKSMPRTALRYAIDLMPKELKADARFRKN
jgi:3-methyladenine DNA glycosylase AlkD